MADFAKVIWADLLKTVFSYNGWRHYFGGGCRLFSFFSPARQTRRVLFVNHIIVACMRRNTRPPHLTPVLTLTLPTFLAKFHRRFSAQCETMVSRQSVASIWCDKAHSGLNQDATSINIGSIAESAAALDSCGQSLISLINPSQLGHQSIPMTLDKAMAISQGC